MEKSTFYLILSFYVMCLLVACNVPEDKQKPEILLQITKFDENYSLIYEGKAYDELTLTELDSIMNK